MRTYLKVMMLVSAPLALAACGEKEAAPEETVVTEETVTEEPMAETTEPVSEVAPVDGLQSSGDATSAEEPAPEMGDGTERNTNEK